MLADVTTPTLDAEPACTAPPKEPAPADSSVAESRRRRRPLVAIRRRFESIPQGLWDSLVARNPWATPFSNWAFHRSWWDAYGATAHEQTLVIIDPSDPDGPARPIAIVPLM